MSSPPFDTLNLGGHRSASGDDALRVAANRAELVASLGLPAEPGWLQQVHGIHVHDVDAHEAVGEPEADAAITRRAGVVLAVLHADCLPVLLTSLDGAVLGAVHAGWRGLAAGVIEATVSAMAVPGASLMAWLGPCAGPHRYEVGDEVRDAFLAHDRQGSNAFVATRSGHWHVDLPALARQRLAALGVTRVSGGTECTISDARQWFSHRRDRRTGRMASLLWRQP